MRPDLETKAQAIVIGGSAGALDALSLLLPVLPRELAVPIAIVMHMLPTRPSLLAMSLAEHCVLKVSEAEDKEPLTRGHVYVAPPDYHLLIEKDHHFSLSVDAPVAFSRPSIDVLFESAADAYGPSLVAVLLSGANEDGARGLARIKQRGGVTLVQAPETAVAAAMPQAAIQSNAATHVLSPQQIGAHLARLR